MGETEEVLERETRMRLERPLRRAFIGLALILTAFPAFIIIGSLAESHLSPLTIFGLLFAGAAMIWVVFDSKYVYRDRLGWATLLIVFILFVVTMTTSLYHLNAIVVTALLVLGLLVSLGAWLALAALRIDARYAWRMRGAFCALFIALILGTFAVTVSALRGEAILLAIALSFCGASLFSLGMRHVSHFTHRRRLEKRWTWSARLLGVSALLPLAPFAQSLADNDSVSEMFWPDALIGSMVVGGFVVFAACIHFVFAMRSMIEAIDRT